MTGIVYVVSNAAMPGLLKIGITTQDDFENRMKNLFGSGVPFPFRLKLLARFKDKNAAKMFEEKLLRKFKEHRPNRDREFLEESVLDQIRDEMKNTAGTGYKTIPSTFREAIENTGSPEEWSAEVKWAGWVKAIRTELVRGSQTRSP